MSKAFEKSGDQQIHLHPHAYSHSAKLVILNFKILSLIRLSKILQNLTAIRLTGLWFSRSPLPPYLKSMNHKQEASYFLWCCFCNAASESCPWRMRRLCLSTSPSIRAKAWEPINERSASNPSSSELSAKDVREPRSCHEADKTSPSWKKNPTMRFLPGRIRRLLGKDSITGHQSLAITLWKNRGCEAIFQYM